MLIKVGESRTVEVDLRLAVSLAAIAGAINAAGFHAVGYFSANMTGNVSALSDHAALGNWTAAAMFLSVVAAFVVGAFASALLIEAGRARQIRGIYAYSILAEAVLLACLGAADLLLPIVHSSPILIIGLSFLMGLQNAATTMITNARVRTTHVSGMATDLGIELAVLTGASSSGEQRAVVRSRFQLHGLSLLAFLVGGVVGVLMFVMIGSYLLLLIAAALVSVALPDALKARRAA